MDFASKTNKYEYAQVVIPANQTDYDIKAQVGNLCKVAPYGFIRLTTNQQITLKFDATTKDGIIITSTESPFMLEWIQFSNMFITTGASGATVGILIARI